MVTLTVANSVNTLSNGYLFEYLPFDKVNLTGQVFGLGTTTMVDNGELLFYKDPYENKTRLYHCSSINARLTELDAKRNIVNFPFICFTSDGTKEVFDYPLELSNHSLRPLINDAILGVENLKKFACDYYGIAMKINWKKLIVSVAARLGSWQLNKFKNENYNPYDNLKKFSFAKSNPKTKNIKWMGDNLSWNICGFYIKQPENGLIVLPALNDNLHLHGCSSDFKYGGHILLDQSEIDEITELKVVPIEKVDCLASKVLIKNANLENNYLIINIENQGSLDVENLDIDIVFDNEYAAKILRRIPYLFAKNNTQIKIDLKNKTYQKLDIYLDSKNTISSSSCKAVSL